MYTHLGPSTRVSLREFRTPTSTPLGNVNVVSGETLRTTFSGDGYDDDRCLPGNITEDWELLTKTYPFVGTGVERSVWIARQRELARARRRQLCENLGITTLHSVSTVQEAVFVTEAGHGLLSEAGDFPVVTLRATTFEGDPVITQFPMSPKAIYCDDILGLLRRAEAFGMLVPDAEASIGAFAHNRPHMQNPGHAIWSQLERGGIKDTHISFQESDTVTDPTRYSDCDLSCRFGRLGVASALQSPAM